MRMARTVAAVCAGLSVGSAATGMEYVWQVAGSYGEDDAAGVVDSSRWTLGATYLSKIADGISSFLRKSTRPGSGIHGLRVVGKCQCLPTIDRQIRLGENHDSQSGSRAIRGSATPARVLDAAQNATLALSLHPVEPKFPRPRCALCARPKPVRHLAPGARTAPSAGCAVAPVTCRIS